MKTTLISALALTLGLTAGLPVAAYTKAPMDAALSADEGLVLPFELARRGRGGDDAPGDDKGGRGRGGDDGPNHASNDDGTEGMIILARRGRGGDDGPGDDRGGRGRGSDDGAGDDRGGSDDDISGSGRRKPRVPGGSGCDDAGDIAEHPECS